MKRTLLALVLALTCVAAGCKKDEPPTPEPEPTPVVVPTEAPMSAATCFAGTHPQTGQPICKDIETNAIVTCPSDFETRRLPRC